MRVFYSVIQNTDDHTFTSVAAQPNVNDIHIVPRRSARLTKVVLEIKRQWLNPTDIVEIVFELSTGRQVMHQT